MVAVAVLGLAGSGAVAQGVSFSGSAGMGVKYTGDMENDAGDTTMKSTIDWISDFDIAISASGTTDGGLTFGASTAVEAGHASSVVTDSEVYIGGESWQVKIGDLDPASHMGRSLGDVGFDGLGVDDVAEKAVTSTHADVEVSFSLGAASLAITAGQTPGKARKPGSPQKTQIVTSFVDNGNFAVHNKIVSLGTYEGRGTVDYTVDLTENDTDDPTTIKVYAHNGSIYKVNGVQDKLDKDGNHVINDDVEDVNPDLADDQPDTLDEVVADTDTPANTAFDAIITQAADAEPATKSDTVWASGVSFAIGSTTLGIGIDSEKLMQASVSADLGAFSGKLFYAQQKMNEGMAKESKNTGMGVEIGVPAGANTTINAVYAQGKTDYKMANMEDKTDKGFGVGVSHGLGGGATLNAGFAKVEDVTKASVGVSMSF